MQRPRPKRLRSKLVVTIVASLAFLLPAGAASAAQPLGQITEFTSGLNPGSMPAAITAGPDGNLWFTDQSSTRAIGRVTPAGVSTEFSAGLNPGSLPTEIVAGADGNLWFTDLGTTRAIGRISTAGQITEFSTGLKPGSVPVGIAAGPDGNLWFADANRAIGRIGTGIPDPPPLLPPSPSIGSGKLEHNRSCKRKHRKALKAKRAHHKLTPSVKRHLRKRLRKCLALSR